MNRPIPLTEEQKRNRIVRTHASVGNQKPSGVREEIDEAAREGLAVIWWQEFVRGHRSWLFSMAAHVVALLVFALCYTTAAPQNEIVLVASTDSEPVELEEIEELVIQPITSDLAPEIVDRVEPESLQPLLDGLSAMEGVDATSVKLTELAMQQAPVNDLLAEAGRGTGVANALGTGKGEKGSGHGMLGMGKGLGGRGGRRQMAMGQGATPESESAVDLALKWLAAHQMPDGGWSFAHGFAPSCQNQCRNPGSLSQARFAATALGVLPFLGAGQTHQVGKYQKTVAGGLMFLIRNMRLKPEGGDMCDAEGRMYGHGLAAIALCEAFAMNMRPEDARKLEVMAYAGSGEASPGEKVNQRNLRPNIGPPIPQLGPAAQAALNFIRNAQDPNGGGWRYTPRVPGDTSVVGWQVMALVSGRMAHLLVDPNCFVGTTRFLDSVQSESGSNYGYTSADRGSGATQSIGLLCRMYLGWRRDHPALEQGVQAISRRGPSSGNMYFNYYATQVMHHAGGDPWTVWNKQMRDSLVASQAKGGHEVGSWHFGGGDHGADKGGRLYCTALAAMTLEVYYRHMPLYGEAAFRDVAQAAPPADAKAKPKRDFPD